MRKLSEFYGQEHVTSILRAMIVKGDIRPRITFYGDINLALDLIQSFDRAVNCLNPQQGDWCGECRNCAGVWLLKKKWLVKCSSLDGSIDGPLEPSKEVIVVTINEKRDGFLELDLRSSVRVLNNKLLSHLVYSVFGDYAEAMKLSREIAAESKYGDIVSKYQEIIIAFSYLEVGLDTNYDKHEILSQIARKLPKSRLYAALKTTWDAAQAADTKLRSEMFLYMMTEAVNPRPVQNIEINGKTEEKPINVVEESSEQPLTMEELLAIAYE